MAYQTIRFVTDSVADLSAELLAQWQITVVPAFVNYGDHSYADDGVELVREDFYEMLGETPNISPKTSAMPPEMAREGFQKAFDLGADHVIAVVTPNNLSGIYNAMRLAMRDFPEGRVTLVDSNQLSMGMGWQVLLGAEVAAETGDVAKTLAAIEWVRKHQHTYAVLTTLEFLRRSGRLSGMAASIGSLLKINLIIQAKDGQVLPVARVRTLRRAFDKLAELIRPHAPFERMAVMHAVNPEGASAMLERLEDVVPGDVQVASVCPAIGVHGGPGIVGVGTVSKGLWDALRARDTG